MNEFGEIRHPEVNEFLKFLMLSEGKLPLQIELGQNLMRIPDKNILSVKVYKIWSTGAILTFKTWF